MTDVKTDAAAAAPAETIEDVRDLLFGADKRAADERIEQIDAKLAQLDGKIAQLDAAQARLDASQARLDASVTQLDARQGELDSRFSRVAQVDGRFAQVDNQFAQFEKWMEQLDSRLGLGLSALIQEKRGVEDRFKRLDDLLDETRAEIVADKRFAETRFGVVSAEARAAEARIDALAKEFGDVFARLERLEAGVEELKRGRGLGQAIGYSLRNFSTTSRSR